MQGAEKMQRCRVCKYCSKRRSNVHDEKIKLKVNFENGKNLKNEKIRRTFHEMAMHSQAGLVEKFHRQSLPRKTV